MRPNLFCALGLIFATVLPGHAQAGADWSRVEHLAADQALRVRHAGQITLCRFVRADQDSLICSEHRTVFFVPRRTTLHLDRGEVQSVKLSRRAASALLGGLIGVGAGAGIGAAIDASAQNQVEEGHLITVTLGLLAGFLGFGVGEHTDFAAGPTLYQAP